MEREPSELSRRDFIRRTVGTGMAVSLGTGLPDHGATPEKEGVGGAEPVTIHVGSPAGPAPLSPPAETSVPFSRGRLTQTQGWTVAAPDGKPVVTQLRTAMRWPDGSIRWLGVCFEATAGPGKYTLREGDSPSAPALAKNQNGRVSIDTGELVISIPQSGSAWLDMLGAPDSAGSMKPLLERGDFVLLRHDGTHFRASLDQDSRRVMIEENGPVKACVRVEGECRAQNRDGLFDYIVRWTAYRRRPELFMTMTWINRTRNPSEQIRDIRVVFPFGFDPDRLVIGCESGVYDGPFLKDWPVQILQEDYNGYWARKHNPDGRIQNLASGGCNGERAPGWLYLQAPSRSLAVWVPRFWEEYPNEISLKEGELSVGLWPEGAVNHLLSKPLLPANPQGTPYELTEYEPVIPHPYLAFLDPDRKCLDARQGVAKTQEIVLSVWAGHGEMPTFEKKWWSKALEPVRGCLDPAYVASTGALGLLWPRDPGNYATFETLFDESYGWLDRHINLQKCYSKFDYGDFKYFTAATDYMCHPGTKWGSKGEMPREGYWQNNERDQLLGLLLYYYRSGDGRGWERCKVVARHLLDVDIRHFPHYGMWTHSYGHCYVALGEAGEPDHSWLLGLLAWAGISGDPVAWDWITKCGDRLQNLKMDFVQVDARTAAVYLHMMCEFFRYTGDARYVESAKAPVEAFLQVQNSNGSWPAYLGNLKQPRIEGFVEHVVMALSDHYTLQPDGRVLKALDQALVYLFGPSGDKDPDLGESPLALFGLALLAKKTGERRYAEVARKILTKLCRSQNLSRDPMGRGDMMAEWGVNNPGNSKGTNRPPQFLEETRPLTPGCVLAYGTPCLAMIAKYDEMAPPSAGRS